VPNNMAAIFTGDFNPDEMIKKVEKTFSYMVAKPITLYNPAPEKPLTKIQQVDVYGPSAEMVEIYYRGYPENSAQSAMLNIIEKILLNGKAGLIDINLNKQQKTLRAGANYQQMKDYGVFSLNTQPRAGQTLEEASKLLLEQIDLLKKGQFDEGLLKAIVANRKLSFLQAFDSNNNRAESLSTSFVLNRGTKWDKDLSEVNESSKITKAQLVAFANTFFKDNYIIGFKHKGVDKNIIKVEKPTITPINANAELTSPFVKNTLAMPVKPIAPKFLDYKKDIAFGKVGIADVLTTKNSDNSIFKMSYRINIGANNYKLLPYASTYLTFLSTDKYTAEELSKAFYDIACTYNVNVGPEVTTINISGLQENFEKAVTLVEHILANVKPNEKALENLKSTILKTRENNKLNKGAIMNGLTTYAQYGSVNPFNNVLTNDEVKNIKSADLISILHNLTNYEHVVTYYGPKDLTTFTADIKKVHLMPKEFTPAAPAKVYTYTTQTANQVYFANYEMVQSEIRWLRNTGLYNKTDAANIEVFNNYFGGGMGSIVFQTIRESKALAYSTFAQYVSPDKADKQYSMIAYVGSQADKMNDAVNGMNELLNTLPQIEKSFDNAKSNVLNGLETSRITKDDIFTQYFADKKLGYDYDSRIDLYKELSPITFASIKDFHTQKVANKPYTYLVVASDKKVKMEDMQKFGGVTTLTLEQLFGY
jgi:predicted Zn-dependent peptidase